MKHFALIDCNNFFVSCERVFDPTLNNKPVVVLSSNDACVIARSNEAKQLGIKMGQAAYQCRDIFKKNNVIVLSSNFTLYGDMSARVMQTVSEFATDIEIYSVDEAFLYFPDSGTKSLSYYTQYAQSIRYAVKKRTGIPISIGIGPTKTVAKIANHIAKKNPFYNGVYDFNAHTTAHATSENNQTFLQKIDVSEIWGIGYRYAKFLRKHKINTVYDFMQCDESWVRQQLTINGLKTLLELKGTVCYDLQDSPEPKQSITVSRLFGNTITDYESLQTAVASYVTIAAEKLRNQQMIATVISIFVCFTERDDHYRIYETGTSHLPLPTAYTPTLITHALHCLEKLYKKNKIYKKAGVILHDFYPDNHLQTNTVIALPNIAKQITLMKTVDTINNAFGKKTVFFAATGTNNKWHAKADKKTKSYTTNWHELLTINL